MKCGSEREKLLWSILDIRDTRWNEQFPSGFVENVWSTSKLRWCWGICLFGVEESSVGVGGGTVSSWVCRGGVVQAVLNLSLASTSDPNRPRSSSVSDTFPSPHSTAKKQTIYSLISSESGLEWLVYDFEDVYYVFVFCSRTRPSLRNKRNWL
jgi:hypothetical protein